MSIDDMIRYIGQIDMELTRNEDIYRKYQLNRKDDIDPGTWDLINRLAEVSTVLMKTKADLTKKLRDEYGIFIV